MKKTLLLSFLSFTFFTLTAQTEITYKSFGDGWVIPVNANIAVDVDENGIVDFYINQYEGELGFSPIFAVGCFSSPDEYAYTSFNSRELSIHEEGDLIQLNGDNLYDYIDDDRGSSFSTTGGLAEGWVDQKEVYLGFALIAPVPNGTGTGVRNGWLTASVNTATNELTIKEWAYNTELELNYEGGILAGDRGETSSVKKLESIEAVSINPNPANAKVQVNFDYSGDENLSVIIQNSVGKEVYRNDTALPFGNTSLNITTSDWANGIYFIRFETATAIRTERLSIAR